MEEILLNLNQHFNIFITFMSSTSINMSVQIHPLIIGIYNIVLFYWHSIKIYDIIKIKEL